jgi:tyrosyl-tRNA synthetase
MHVGNHTLNPLINGLSDRGGQILQLRNINIPTRLNTTKTIRNFSKHNIQNFKTNLSYEIWDTIFGKQDANETFNNFHNTFLRIFHSSFPEKEIQLQDKVKTWITKGIQTSIKNKGELYLKCRNSNNHKLKNYYKSYCKLLAKIITQAKALHYRNQILRSNNESKTVWDIVKSQTGKKKMKDEMSILDTDGKTNIQQAENCKFF